MRRSICYCEPAVALAGQVSTWKFLYTPATTLPKGSLLKFDLLSKGRAIDWQPPATQNGKGANTVWLELPNGKTAFAKCVDSAESIIPQYEFTLPAAIPSGTPLTFFLGNLDGDEKGGNTAQNYIQRRRPFHLYVDPSGKGQYQEPEVFSLDIRGAKLYTIRILAPSFVAKNKRFDVVVRFEDEFGNLTSNAPDDTLIELSYENIRENLNWKPFVPETGFITLPNLYFNEPGIYTICLTNLTTGQVYRSSPIKCFAENDNQLVWGLLHGESEKYDSTENIESCLRHFRDEKALNFAGASPFESAEETPNEVWKTVSQNIADFDEDDRFSTFLGCQWVGEPKKEGLRQILFNKDSRPILRKKEAKYASLDKLYRNFPQKEVLAIPSFTMGSPAPFDFQHFYPEYERVVEIYNAWGSSECTAKEGNDRPIHASSKKGAKEMPEGSVLKALLAGHRFGFVAGGLDDRDLYQDFYDIDQEQYSPGLTAIITPQHSRDAIWEALFQRSCYATTGERIILGLELAKNTMGTEINTTVKPGLLVNRHLSGFVAGTARLQKVEIVCNGQVVQTFSSDTYHLEFEYDHLVPLESLVVKTKVATYPFVFYYLRVTQEDGHMAWSSPIWVDLTPAAERAAAKKVQKPVKKAPISFDEDEEDEEEEEDFFDEEEDEEEENF
ncbi:MAG: hypothetical protein K0S07_352 [Chlamydiales bacterium]|jgi:hypothetical protein|nr:hypothetical protein [Chlamydiales bacterium]